MNLIRSLVIFLMCGSLSASAGVFSLVYIGDLHADYPGSDAAPLSDMQILSQWLTNHVADGTYNAAIVASSGDLMEQGASVAPAGRLTTSALTNYFNDWKGLGLRIWLTAGNHDADQLVENCFGWGMDGTNIARAWTNVFPLSFFTNQIGFITNSPLCPFGGPNDSKQCVMTYTNGSTKLVWLPYHHSITNAIYVSGDRGAISSYIFPSMLSQVQQQTDWLKGVAAGLPGHMAIFGAHSMVGVNLLKADPLRAYLDPDGSNSGAVKYLGVPMPIGRLPIDCGALGTTNVLTFLTGHNRNGIYGRVFLKNDFGQTSTVELHNYQQNGLGARMALILTFNDQTKRVRFRTLNIVTDEISRECYVPFTYPRQHRLLLK